MLKILGALQGIAGKWGRERKIKPFWLIAFLPPSLQDYIFKYILWFKEQKQSYRTCVFVPCTWVSDCQQFWTDCLEGLGSLMFCLRILHASRSDATITWLMCDLRHKKFCENKFRLRSWAGENLQTRSATRFAFHSLPLVVCLSLKVFTKVSCVCGHQVILMLVPAHWASYGWRPVVLGTVHTQPAIKWTFPQFYWTFLLE